MLSSSIHNYEMAHNFKSIRLIPSLNGNLYKFDGDDIEQLPITADDLLRSSFQFPDELVSNLVISGEVFLRSLYYPVMNCASLKIDSLASIQIQLKMKIISGGRETRSYGVSTRNGRVMYECSIHGCKDTTDINNDLDQYGGPYEIESDQHDPQLDDVIIIRRETQTVRAVEALNGGERWNFSVGTHELELIKSGDCHNRPYSEYDQTLLDLELKVIVPEGIVCAVNKHTPNVILWQHQFSHPIVNAWKNSKDDLVKLDLFSYTHLPFGINESPNLNGVAPAVYVAMYEKQLYIQESDKIKRTGIMKNLKYLESLKIPWKPYSVPTSEFAMIEGTFSSDDQDESSVTALSVLHGSEYVNGNGYYLFANLKAKRRLVRNHNLSKAKDDVEEKDGQFSIIDENTPTAVVMVTLWFWW